MKGVLKHLIQVVIKFLAGRLYLNERNDMAFPDERDVNPTLLVLGTDLVLIFHTFRIGCIPSEVG